MSKKFFPKADNIFYEDDSENDIPDFDLSSHGYDMRLPLHRDFNESSISEFEAVSSEERFVTNGSKDMNIY